MKENKLPYTHLMYVRKYSIITNGYELYIVGVNTNDIYHTMGEYLFRSETQVKRIDPIECMNCPKLCGQHKKDLNGSKN